MRVTCWIAFHISEHIISRRQPVLSRDLGGDFFCFLFWYFYFAMCSYGKHLHLTCYTSVAFIASAITKTIKCLFVLHYALHPWNKFPVKYWYVLLSMYGLYFLLFLLVITKWHVLILPVFKWSNEQNICTLLPSAKLELGALDPCVVQSLCITPMPPKVLFHHLVL